MTAFSKTNANELTSENVFPYKIYLHGVSIPVCIQRSGLFILEAGQVCWKGNCFSMANCSADLFGGASVKGLTNYRQALIKCPIRSG